MMSDMAISQDAAAKMRRYEEIKIQIRELEEEAEVLKPIIVKAMPDQVEVAGEAGTFVVQKRATWKFSEKHKEQKEKLKELEATEKAKGIAIPTYSDILVYTLAKPQPPAEEQEA